MEIPERKIKFISKLFFVIFIILVLFVVSIVLYYKPESVTRLELFCELGECYVKVINNSYEYSVFYEYLKVEPSKDVNMKKYYFVGEVFSKRRVEYEKEKGNRSAKNYKLIKLKIYDKVDSLKATCYIKPLFSKELKFECG